MKFFLILFVHGFFFIQTGCRDSASASAGQRMHSDLNYPVSGEGMSYINFRSFQNPDKTWGFTIFVNSMPYRHYSRIPYKRLSGGFISREEAENVATLFVKMIRSGEDSPRLDRRSVDTLKITIDKKKAPPS